MKTLVIYDSEFGNTEKIAEAIGKALGEETQVTHVEKISADHLHEYELVIAGSPTQGGRPTPLVKEFLSRIPDGSLKNVKVTGFDTRIASAGQSFMMKFFMGILGFAAGRIARRLEAKGGQLVKEPEGFIVDGKEGPLHAGEIERAEAWAYTIAQTVAASN
jgi:flavodoxin I